MKIRKNGRPMMDVAATLAETTTISTNSHRITAIIAPLVLGCKQGESRPPFLKTQLQVIQGQGEANKNIATKAPSSWNAPNQNGKRNENWQTKKGK